MNNLKKVKDNIIISFDDLVKMSTKTIEMHIENKIGRKLKVAPSSVGIIKARDSVFSLRTEEETNLKTRKVIKGKYR